MDLQPSCSGQHPPHPPHCTCRYFWHSGLGQSCYEVPPEYVPVGGTHPVPAPPEALPRLGQATPQPPGPPGVATRDVPQWPAGVGPPGLAPPPATDLEAGEKAGEGGGAEEGREHPHRRSIIATAGAAGLATMGAAAAGMGAVAKGVADAALPLTATLLV